MKKNHRTKGAPSFDSIAARLTEEQGLRLASTSRARKAAPSKPHIDDIAVDQLATAMKARLAVDRAWSAGWDDPRQWSVERLSQKLAETLCKGNPVAVANFAAMLHARGASHRVIAEQALRALLRGSREDQSRRIAELEAAHSQTIDERDAYHDIADKLASAIATHLRVDIGEHSSANCPWQKALSAIEATPPTPQRRSIDDCSPREWDLASRNTQLAAENKRLVDALTRITHMRNRNGQEVDMHREELRGIARAALPQAIAQDAKR